MYKTLIRPLLFRFDAERAHALTFFFLKLARTLGFVLPLMRLFAPKAPNGASLTLFGLHFPHPVGLAAGLDKNASAFEAFGAMGFAFVEIGTVTPRPQAGNPKPRLFRLIPNLAVINRMGFNNDGAIAIAKRLRKRKTRIIVGGNIGKNTLTPNEKATDDYVACFEALFPFVDYFVVNVSCPNIKDLNKLHNRDDLTRLLSTLQSVNRLMDSPKPILLKISPDLTTEQLDETVEIALETGIAGFVATNTTTARPGLSPEQIENIGPGGLSGKPLSQRSTLVIRHLAQRSRGRLPIVAAGGIMSADEAIEKLEAGASLLQLYTGFIYEGPGLIRAILKRLATK